MIMLQRKLKCKYTGTDEYMPKEITRDRMMPVIGFEVQRREVEYEGKKRIEDDLYFLVINNKGHVVRIAAWTCNVVIDDEDRVMSSIAQSIGSASSLLLNSSNEGTIRIETIEGK